MPTTSYWADTASLPKFAPLQRDIDVDVAIVGGGNTGITTAYLMKQAGLKVALLERDRCDAVDTGHTSAHLTCVTDLKLSKLISRLGRDHAQAVWDAGMASIQQIEDIIHAENINCGFARVPGFLVSSLHDGSSSGVDLREEAQLGCELGFNSEYVDSVPIFHHPGVRYPNQAHFHPLKYAQTLLSQIDGDGSYVCERTEAQEFADDSMQITANGHKVNSQFIVIATDVPLMGKTGMLSATLFQTKIAPYTSYVVGAKLPQGAIADGLFWDTSDPYFYLRMEQRADHDYVIFGGLDHKTGQEDDPDRCFHDLEEMLRKFVPQAQFDHRWSGQVIESVDGLPFIGETAPRQFVATGFSGNGLTFGTVAAMMACDAALGRRNPWRELFAADRKKLSSIFNYVLENIDYPYYMIKDRLTKSEGRSVRSVKRGEGKILSLQGQRVAVYRDESGHVTQLSPHCTHMGCLVQWNSAEQTWDCPCHGSRFHATGETLAGPAETPLPHIEKATANGHASHHVEN